MHTHARTSAGCPRVLLASSALGSGGGRRGEWRACHLRPAVAPPLVSSSLSPWHLSASHTCAEAVRPSQSQRAPLAAPVLCHVAACLPAAAASVRSRAAFSAASARAFAGRMLNLLFDCAAHQPPLRWSASASAPHRVAAARLVSWRLSALAERVCRRRLGDAAPWASDPWASRRWASSPWASDPCWVMRWASLS